MPHLITIIKYACCVVKYILVFMYTVLEEAGRLVTQKHSRAGRYRQVIGWRSFILLKLTSQFQRGWNPRADGAETAETAGD